MAIARYSGGAVVRSEGAVAECQSQPGLQRRGLYNCANVFRVSNLYFTLIKRDVLFIINEPK